VRRRPVRRPALGSAWGNEYAWSFLEQLWSEGYRALSAILKTQVDDAPYFRVVDVNADFWQCIITAIDNDEPVQMKQPNGSWKMD
jgi:hypothetical protein